MFDRKIVYERLSTGFPIAPLDGGGWTKRDKRWEVTGFIDEIRYAQKVVTARVKAQRERRRKRAEAAIREQDAAAAIARAAGSAAGIAGGSRPKQRATAADAACQPVPMA